MWNPILKPNYTKPFHANSKQNRRVRLTPECGTYSKLSLPWYLSWWPGNIWARVIHGVWPMFLLTSSIAWLPDLSTLFSPCSCSMAGLYVVILNMNNGALPEDHTGHHSTDFWGSLCIIQFSLRLCSKIPALSAVSLPLIKVLHLLLLQHRKLVPNKELGNCETRVWSGSRWVRMERWLRG